MLLFKKTTSQLSNHGLQLCAAIHFQQTQLINYSTQQNHSNSSFFNVNQSLSHRNFLSNSKCNIVKYSTTVPTSQPIKPPSTPVPKVKDPEINGLKLRFDDIDGHKIPILEEISTTKFELIEKFGFELRDLRAVQIGIHGSYKHASPTFFVRIYAFLAHLKDITAIISSSECYLFNTSNIENRENDLYNNLVFSELNEQDVMFNFNLLDKFLHKLSLTLHSSNRLSLSFEFHCLEAVCSSVVSKYRSKLFQLEKLCNLLRNIRVNPVYNSNNISIVKIELIESITNVKSQVDAFNNLLNNHDDMNTMYLSASPSASAQKTLDNSLELLLENYLWQTDEILDRLQLLLDEMTMHERSCSFEINKQRNDIIRMNLKLSVLTCGFAGGSLCAGLFGMNLLSTFETHPYMFWPSTVLFGFIMPITIWRHFKIDLKSKNIII